MLKIFLKYILIGDIMQINIERLNIEINKFDKILSDYNAIYYSYYQEIKNVELYWHDPNANGFISNILEEEKDNKKLINELNNIKNSYYKIINSYIDYGNKIIYNSKNTDNTINKFNKSISKLEEIISTYSNLDIDKLPIKINNLIEEKEKLLKLKEQIENIKEETKTIINNIEDSEKQIKAKLSEITIESVRPNTKENKKIGSTDEIYIDSHEIEKIKDKLLVYQRQEEICFENIIEQMKIINYLYITNNTNYLEDIKFELENKFKIINTNHYNNVLLLNNNIELYENATRKAIKVMEEGLEEINHIDFDINTNFET